MLASGLSEAPLSRIPGAQGSALGFACAVLATLVGRSLGAGTQPMVGLVLLASVALGVGALTTVPGAVAGAAQCWGMYSGFELYRFGELRLDERSTPALLVLLTLGAGASAATLAVNAYRIRVYHGGARLPAPRLRRRAV